MIGKTIKNLREERGISQTDFYQGLISKRQAIRFEQDESDVKGIVLLDLLQRLELSTTELESMIELTPVTEPTLAYYKLEQKLRKTGNVPDGFNDFYQKYRESKNKMVQRLAILAKLHMAGPLSEADSDFLMAELHASTILTIAQTRIFVTNFWKFPDYESQEIATKLSENAANNELLKHDHALLIVYYQTLIEYFLLQKGELTKAKRLIKQYQQDLSLFDDNQVIAYRNWEMLIELASTKEAKIHEDLSQRAQLILLLGMAQQAEQLIDFRVRVEEQYKLNHNWSTGEIGMVARKLNRLPKGEKQQGQDLLKSYEGLAQSIREKNQPISSYLNDYDY